ncbi:putative LRR receptor-like serine/threonine-protein kinase EFR-like [Capsicum annuum]|nr:putative LRR receptor-like serine/threonine-protein kinase EFR-like [Capsicum annuum]
MDLSGRIPPDLGNLSFLVSFDLESNNFHGNLPQEMTCLRRLKFLDLSFNNFSGKVPWFRFLHQVHVLSLRNNSFTGSLPSSIFNISTLEMLNLAFNSLEGHIPVSLSYASRLQMLELSYNSIKGDIPDGIGNLPNMNWLSIQHNQLTGSISFTVLNISRIEIIAFTGNSLSGNLPNGLCNGFPILKELYLSGNKLFGHMPTSLPNCSQHQVLSLSKNEFDRPIHCEIGRLSNLQQLYLGANHFQEEVQIVVVNSLVFLFVLVLTGEIPNEISNLVVLEKLNLQFNSFSGSLEMETFNISGLRVISLSHNNLSGSLPPNMGSILPNIEELNLGSLSNLVGTIPHSISNCSELTILELSNNQLTGLIPNSIGYLAYLQYLNLALNNLTSESSLSFLNFLTNCRNLTTLSLTLNPLNGMLSVSTGNLSTSLRNLYANVWKIKGRIPNEVGNLSRFLSRNYLVGSIPKLIGNFRNLQGLFLSNNKLTGSIGDNLCKLQFLDVIDLTQNKFSGSLPYYLGKITSLREIRMGLNKLSTNIPSSLGNIQDLVVLELLSNNMVGSLPLEIGNLKAAILIDLSMNQFSNRIPREIAGLQNLAHLSLRHNKFQGTIPDSMSNMVGLEFLDLSHNNISGIIPKSLEKLKNLKYFNISFNKLYGEIPSGDPFKNLSIVFVPMAFVLLWIRFRRGKSAPQQAESLSAVRREKISYYELLQATDDLSESNLIGFGSFGSVYKGVLRSGTAIAVKVFNLQLDAAFKSFDTECEVLRSLRHRNLVKVITSCSNLDFKALVRDYMPNGSLEKSLYSHNYFLDIKHRLSRMIDVACDLEYLHNGCLFPVIHCDVKPSNVLLDEDMVANLSDFGISKLLGEDQGDFYSKTLATFGYIAPVCGLEGLVSTKCDVYSYGVMLLEKFSRRKPNEFEGDLSLKQWASYSLPDAVMEVIDANLITSTGNCLKKKLDVVASIMKVALDCCNESPTRTNMKDVGDSSSGLYIVQPFDRTSYKLGPVRVECMQTLTLPWESIVPTSMLSRAMASSSNSSGVTQPLIPIFTGESYEFWSIRMKTILKSQNLWDLVESWFADPDEEKNEEKAFQVKDATTNYGGNNGPARRGRGRRRFHGGRGCGYARGRGRSDGHKQSNEQGHKPIDLWFVDSGCSNHMTGTKSMFQELNDNPRKKVQLGNTKEMQIEGKGKVIVDTSHDKVKVLDNVQFVPYLGYNLISIGQLMTYGYSLWLEDDACHYKQEVRQKETFHKFKQFKAMVEKQSGLSIKTFHTDRDGEFLSKEFNFFCEESGIHRDLTTPYTPEKTGIAERKNCAIVEMARSMLQGKGLSNHFLDEAVATSVHLLNLSPTKAVLNKTPIEAWRGRKPFNSTAKWYSYSNGFFFNFPGFSFFSFTDSSSTTLEESPDEPIPLRRSTRPTKPNPQYANDMYTSCQFSLADPTHYGEAAKKKKWWSSMVEERNSIEKNRTWEMVELLEDKNAIGLKEKAFLNGDEQEEVYVAQPEGFIKKGDETKVYKLKKALYGLKQAPRACLEVPQAEDVIFLSQRKYARDLLIKFGFLNCKPAATPLNIGEKLQLNDGAEMDDARSFRSLVGGLIYLTQTHPDIAFSVGVISRFMQQPSKVYFGAAKRVLRYIAGNTDYGIWYSQVSNFRLCGFTGSDYAGSLDDRRSILAHVFTLSSGVVTWSSKKKATTMLSISKSDYIAATSAACQAIWLRRMLAELQHKQERAIEIYGDNKASIAMTKNPSFHSRTKHIDVHFHFICDLVAKEQIIVKHCSTHKQLADILTKSLAADNWQNIAGRQDPSVNIKIAEGSAVLLEDYCVSVVRRITEFYSWPGDIVMGSGSSAWIGELPIYLKREMVSKDSDLNFSSTPSEGIEDEMKAAAQDIASYQRSVVEEQPLFSGVNAKVALLKRIPQDFGNLSFLASLNLGRNNFHGNLPQEMAHLRRLKFLDLIFNNFKGKVPSSFGILHQLQVLNLRSNSFTGFIPSFSNMSTLETLNLAFNSLEGHIPVSLSNASRLETLQLSYNSLQGNIPEGIGSLHNMDLLGIEHNKLVGSIPLTIFNISRIKFIAFTGNSLSGSLPNGLCNGLPILKGLYLSSNKLHGHMPTRMSNCSQLQLLDLLENEFDGPIHSEIGRLSNLQILDLGTNHFTGIIPQEIGHLVDLVELAMEDNQITGSVPISIFNISSLQIFSMWRNNLSGFLPREIGNLTKMQRLHLTGNKLIGKIPKEISNLIELEVLTLGFNSFSGSLDFEIFNISGLRIIELSHNNLSGSLPSNIDSILPNIESLFLGGLTNLVGSIPHSISYCSKLTILELAGNKLIGLIPSSLGYLTHLQILNIAENNLTSDLSLSFLTSLTNCRNLTFLSLYLNPLNGMLPASTGNLSTFLRTFFAISCKIQGRIPDEVGNLSSLFDLRLSGNNLVGSIPTTFGNLRNLQCFNLSNNKLTGFIGDQICKLQNLGDNYFGLNKLSGSLPNCLGNITSLREIHLNSNKLSSSIPPNIGNLVVFDLSSNNRVGSLPPEIGNLKAATLIDLSFNRFSNGIPMEIGGLHTLVHLSLRHNKLQGYIPDSMSNMVGLEFLDLSHNNISGIIPNSLVTLQNLKNFNVSVNKLNGEIPFGGSFQELLEYRRGKRAPRQPDSFVAITRDRISYYELLQATEALSESNLIGSGSFGSVYKGVLRSGTAIAFKVFNLQLDAAFKSFDTECEVLRSLRHRNLLKVIASCSNLEFKALVLEYMPNGSLEKYLYSHNYFLDIRQRLRIMIDVACALEYLHHGCSSAVIHCDLKPSNVLLDEDMVAHLRDFGISKLLGEDESDLYTKTLATLGYIAPEYGLDGLVSTKCDVYSYGIMLLETFTRRKPNEFEGDLSLKQWVSYSLPDAVMEVVDVNLLTSTGNRLKELDVVASIMKVSLDCCNEFPTRRTNMKDVVGMLQKIKIQLLAC